MGSLEKAQSLFYFHPTQTSSKFRFIVLKTMEERPTAASFS